MQVRVTNRGTSGDGSCMPLVTILRPDGDTSIRGQRITVTDVASGATVTEVPGLDDATPDGQGLLLPGLQPGAPFVIGVTAGWARIGDLG